MITMFNERKEIPQSSEIPKSERSADQISRPAEIRSDKVESCLPEQMELSDGIVTDTESLPEQVDVSDKGTTEETALPDHIDLNGGEFYNKFYGLPDSMDFPHRNVERGEDLPDHIRIEKSIKATDDRAIRSIPCRNGDLAGGEHPVTGVPFVRKTVEVDGESVEVVVPLFDSVFDTFLPDDLLKASDLEQFKYCNEQLKKAVHNDPELRKQFSEEQLEQIENGDTPDGYTWHHDAETGKMQLVDTETHQRTGHTGGRSIWGGGNEAR